MATQETRTDRPARGTPDAVVAIEISIDVVYWV